MLSIIAWRNVWRNKIRSLVVILSITLGLWAGVFILAFSFGMSEQYVNSAIDNQISHIQLHNPEFLKDKDISYTIPNGMDILKQLQSNKNIKAACGRVIVTGMASSPTSGSGVTINGIFPSEEDSVTHLNKEIKQGTYFKSKDRNQLVIGEKLAHKLKLKLRNKLVLTFQNSNKDIVSGAFRIVGIFKSANSAFDEMNVFVKAKDVEHLLGTHNSIHEIAILLNKSDQVDPVAASLRTRFPKLSVQTWKQIAPELELIIDSYSQSMYIFIVIILLALAFGIVNTMLMVVLERVRELGMLMAIGMTKTKVFFMIVLETIYLTAVGTPLGLLLSYITTEYFGKKGINISMFSEGLAHFGMSSMVYPELAAKSYWDITMLVVVITILSAIYPARKALQLKPAASIRKI